MTSSIFDFIINKERMREKPTLIQYKMANNPDSHIGGDSS